MQLCLLSVAGLGLGLLSIIRMITALQLLGCNGLRCAAGQVGLGSGFTDSWWVSRDFSHIAQPRAQAAA